jgi:hypothetical protein
MNYRDAFQIFKKSGLPIDQFALETSRINNRLCMIVATPIDNSNKVMFDQIDIPMSGAHTMLKRINETARLITTAPPIQLVVNNTTSRGPIDADEWGLGHPESESVRQKAN